RGHSYFAKRGHSHVALTRGADGSPLAEKADTLRRAGATVVFVALDGACAALIAVADPIRQSAAEAVAALKTQGLRVVMLTGDNHPTARAVAAKLGLESFEAEVAPEGKAERIARLKREGRVVAMAGDGVNDAPALAAADVGVAMGTGTDVAIESAGMTLLKGDLQGLVRARPSTILPKAAPMITPMARLSALPFSANSLNSCHMLLSLPFPQGVAFSRLGLRSGG